MSIYVERGSNNKIKAIYRNKQEGIAEELLDDNHVEVSEFLNPVPTLQQKLSETDKDIIRIIEDLVVVISKSNNFPIKFPKEAIDKINNRLELRGKPKIPNE